MSTTEVMRRKSGKYSRYAPARLLERYETALSDPEYVSVRDSVALWDARISELLEAYGDGSSAQLWVELIDRWMDFTRAISTGNMAVQTTLLGQIDQLIRQGSTVEKSWRDIGEAMEARRKLVDSEVKNRATMSQNITVEQAMALLGLILNVLKESAYKYADPEVARKIISDTGAAYQRAISVGQSQSNGGEFVAVGRPATSYSQKETAR